MRTVLLYNPKSGKDRERRVRLVQAATTALQRNGFVCRCEPTRSVSSIRDQVLAAIEKGAEAIIACGGDGTIHHVLQAIVGRNAVLGILPFGSANATAREIGLPKSPLKAAALLRPTSRTSVQIGLIRTSLLTNRYFLSMAGAGPDGALMYRMVTVDRSRLGRLSYYLHAPRLFLSQSFPCFQVTYTDPFGEKQAKLATAVMALRIGRLGGLFAGLAPGATLQRDDMLLLLVHPPAWLSLPFWFISGWTGLNRLNSHLTTVRTRSVTLTDCCHSKLHLQADGEWLGCGEAEILLTEQRVELLVPDRTTLSPASSLPH